MTDALLTDCCGARPEVTARVSLRMPWDVAHNLTKARLRRADVQIEAADWDRMLWSCPTCHRVWPPGEVPPMRERMRG